MPAAHDPGLLAHQPTGRERDVVIAALGLDLNAVQEGISALATTVVFYAPGGDLLICGLQRCSLQADHLFLHLRPAA